MRNMNTFIRVAGVLPAVLMLTLTAGAGGRAIAAAGETNAPSTSAQTAEVKIDNFSFTPQTITVKAGTAITWTNQDDIPHTVVSTDQIFKSKTLDTDDKFTTTLTKPGTYPYFCSIHPKMTGTVIVE
jgi:plastocyanin